MIQGPRLGLPYLSELKQEPINFGFSLSSLSCPDNGPRAAAPGQGLLIRCIDWLAKK